MARLQVLRSESGFNFIELMIVLAISSSLILIAFVGQRSLRARAQFDAAVERVVSTVSSAQTEAVAAVSLYPGGGTGVNGCGSGTPPTPTNPVVFAGTTWSANGLSGNAIFQIDRYRAIPGAGASAACIFDTQVIGLPSDVLISPAGNVSGIMFVRTNTGALSICPLGGQPSVGAFQAAARQAFSDSTCTNGPLNLTLTDADGHVADIQVDASGMARRLN